MGIHLIFAMDRNRTIGIDNRLPWRLPADMAHFVHTTTGHAVLMGRKTYESIGKPLKDRLNVILTRDPNYTAEGCEIVHSVEEAMERFRGQVLFVIGGAEVYKLFLPYADHIHMTRIDFAFDGDAFFPEYDEKDWILVEERQGLKDERNPYDYQFLTYRRQRATM